ncbi:MAG: DUF3617 domain-containing protein [Burkholderiaceae bacterium]|nr:DUF3617 domain-containing protein [Burkholderiaceae bacterium]MCX8005031.1 DUF3617 domain-containing protein [Burkholderiaceae bacterium]
MLLHRLTIPFTGISLVFGAAVAPIAVAQPKGEEWEYALTMQMEGMKMPLPPSRVCLRPDEGHAPETEKHCTFKERKVSGATTTFHIVCGPPDPGEVKGSYTRKGDRVEGRYTIKRGANTMTVQADGRRLGRCDPSKAPAFRSPS